MARIIYSGLVSEIKGSIAGTTFQSNRYGYTVKHKPRQSVPGSAAQWRRKADLQSLMLVWSELTDSERAGWAAWATTYPQASKNNPSAYLTGYTLFLRIHLAMRQADPQFLLEEPTAAPIALPVGDWIVDETAGAYTAGFEGVAPASPLTIIVFLSRPILSTQSYIKSWTRFMGSYTCTIGDEKLNITARYPEVFGSLPPVGSILAADFTVYQPDSGQLWYIPSQQIPVT